MNGVVNDVKALELWFKKLQGRRYVLTQCYQILLLNRQIMISLHPNMLS